jgi:hypothetical protein
MDKSLHLIRGPFLAMTLLAFTLGTVSVLPFGAGMDCVAAYVRTIWESERLDQDREVLFQSLKVIRSILDQVIEGQLPLPQGACALRDEIKSRPEHLRPPAYEHSLHVPQAECYLHQLLDMADNHLDGDPRREKVLKRLRKEFESVSRPPGD